MTTAQISGDIAVLPDVAGYGDCAFVGSDVAADSGLATAVYISLFTDCIEPESGVGGYWGDGVDLLPLGSLLWTLWREKTSPDLPERIRQYCASSLQWMIDERIAAAVDVTVTRLSLYTYGIEIDVTKPAPDAISIKYSYTWMHQAEVVSYPAPPLLTVFDYPLMTEDDGALRVSEAGSGISEYSGVTSADNSPSTVSCSGASRICVFNESLISALEYRAGGGWIALASGSSSGWIAVSVGEVQLRAGAAVGYRVVEVRS